MLRARLVRSHPRLDLLGDQCHELESWRVCPYGQCHTHRCRATSTPTVAPGLLIEYTTTTTTTTITPTKGAASRKVTNGANREVGNTASNDMEPRNGLIPATMVAAGVFLLTTLLIGVKSRRSVSDMDDYSSEPQAKKGFKVEQHHDDDDGNIVDHDDSPSTTPYGTEPPPARQQTIQMQDGQTMIHLPSEYMTTIWAATIPQDHRP